MSHGRRSVTRMEPEPQPLGSFPKFSAPDHSAVLSMVALSCCIGLFLLNPPCTQGGRAQGQLTACKGHLLNLATLLELYAADHQGTTRNPCRSLSRATTCRFCPPAQQRPLRITPIAPGPSTSNSSTRCIAGETTTKAPTAPSPDRLSIYRHIGLSPASRIIPNHALTEPRTLTRPHRTQEGGRRSRTARFRSCLRTTVCFRVDASRFSVRPRHPGSPHRRTGRRRPSVLPGGHRPPHR